MGHKLNFKLSGWLFLLLFTALFIFSACNKRDASQSEEYQKLVKVTRVKAISSRLTKSYPAVIEAVDEVNLAFRVSGPIESIFVREGQYVEKGTLLAQMDMRDYEVQKEVIEAQVVQLRSEYDRIEELNKREGISDNDFEKMKAGKTMAEAQLKNANDQLRDTKIFAPFSGYITSVYFDQGELVGHGTSVVSMLDMSLLKLEVDIPASLYIYKDQFMNLSFTQNEMSDTVFQLEFGDNNVKANASGLYKLYLYHKTVPNSPLAPGMNAMVDIEYQISDIERLMVPISSIFNMDDRAYVWMVCNHVVERREVQVGGSFDGGYVTVTGNIHENDQIVAGGIHLLHQGEQVRIVEKPSKTNVGNIL